MSGLEGEVVGRGVELGERGGSSAVAPADRAGRALVWCIESSPGVRSRLDVWPPRVAAVQERRRGRT